MMTIIASAKAALTAIEAANATLRWVAIAGIAVGLVAVYAIWHHEVYQSGVDDTIAKIAREDKALVDRAWEARGQWQACRDLKRGWDQTTGKCQ